MDIYSRLYILTYQVLGITLRSTRMAGPGKEWKKLKNVFFVLMAASLGEAGGLSVFEFGQTTRCYCCCCCASAAAAAVAAIAAAADLLLLVLLLLLLL